MEALQDEKVLEALESEEIHNISLTNKEYQDVLGAINIVIKNLDATFMDDLERYTKLFKKIADR